VYEQATVRHMPSGGLSSENITRHERKPSDDDYDDQYLDTYPRGGTVLERRDVPEDEELPDTTMLDSVILPAIASVKCLILLT
jgi:serine/threonine-protein kinase 24/25/MST4